MNFRFKETNGIKREAEKKKKGKTSNSTKIVCEIANSLQKKVIQDSNLTRKIDHRPKY